MKGAHLEKRPFHHTFSNALQQSTLIQTVEAKSTNGEERRELYFVTKIRDVKTRVKYDILSTRKIIRYECTFLAFALRRFVPIQLAFQY